MNARSYAVRRAPGPVPTIADWEGPSWQGVPFLAVDQPVGGMTAHRPRTMARLCWDPEFLHVIFRVEDRYVRAVAARYQDAVCLDSCVEFFFTPGTDLRQGYFNIEMNCAGVALFRHQRDRGTGRRDVEEEDGRRLAPAHTLSGRIDPELPGPLTWVVAYRVPLDALARYAPVERPGPGVTWRANLYKCGDGTSHPHWLAWSPVDVPRPDFHRSEFFGVLEFAP